MPKINNSGVVYSVQEGYYIKTGKLITISAKIETTTKSTEPDSNVISIGGFPFTPSAKSVGKALFNVKVANATTVLGATVGHFASPSIFTISMLGNNSTNLYNAIKVSDTTDTTNIWISGQYFVD